jgi:hypothetical protein
MIPGFGRSEVVINFTQIMQYLHELWKHMEAVAH